MVEKNHIEHSDQQIPQKTGKIGFIYAWNGIKYFFSSQFNARIHALLTLLVVIMGIFFKISTMEWLIILLCIGVVFTAEIMNTAIELLTDLVSPGYNKKAGLIKDLAAGAVLVSALVSAIIGFWIFIPKIILFIGGIGTLKG